MALPRCDTWPHAVKTPIRGKRQLGPAHQQAAELDQRTQAERGKHRRLHTRPSTGH